MSQPTITADEAKALLRWHGVQHTHGLRPRADDDCEACELDAERDEALEERARDLARTVVAQAAGLAAVRAAAREYLDAVAWHLCAPAGDVSAAYARRDAAHAALAALV